MVLRLQRQYSIKLKIDRACSVHALLQFYSLVLTIYNINLIFVLTSESTCNLATNFPRKFISETFTYISLV